MCGIFAWWKGETIALGGEKTLKALTAMLDRGPDEQHVWSNDDRSAYLAHCRLKITGENGAQPLWSADRCIVALVNGQFYNHQQLRHQCQQKGYTFLTDTDSELLLALYQFYGVDCLEYLDGEFAFVLWNRTTDTVWAARDRSGVKPLRFVLCEDQLMFASEAKALFAAGIPARWNKTTLSQALMFQYPNPRQTLFQGIQQIAPGEYIVAQRTNGMWSAVAQRWWHWFEHANTQSKDEEYIERLEHAVAQRVDGAWPTAVHLSAGCDSTTALIMARGLGHNVEAFSVGFENEQGHTVAHDESTVAQHSAQQLGIPFHRVQATRADLYNNWDRAVLHAENIGINGHLVAKSLLAKDIHHKGFRVSISGEGADETLLGYPFLTAELGGDLAQLQRSNPVSVGLMLPDTQQLDFSVVEEIWGFIPVWLQAKSSLGWKIRQLMREEWINEYAGPAQENWAVAGKNLFDTEQQRVHKSAASWAVLALGNYILPTLADAPEAGHQIQGRVPFLGRDVMQYATSLTPYATGFPHETKAPLRNFLRANGFSAIAERSKHPFQAPPLLGCNVVRQQLKAQWSQPQLWEGMPFCPQKIQHWIDQWDHWDIQQHQKWEPVVATILSVVSLSHVFRLT